MDNSQSITSPFGGTGGFSNTDLSKWGNTGSSLKWSKRWSDKLYTNALVSYSNFFSNRDNTNSSTFTTANGNSYSEIWALESNNLTDFSAKIDVEYKTSSNNNVLFGIQANKLAVDYSYSQNDTLEIIGKRDRGNLIAAYLQDELKLGNLALKGGMRMSYFSPTSKTLF